MKQPAAVQDQITALEAVATYRLGDMRAARAFRDQLRAECWDAFISRAGDSVFVMIRPPT